MLDIVTIDKERRKTTAVVHLMFSRMRWSTLKIFQPKYRLGHPEYYLFLSSIKKNVGSKYPKNINFNFGKNFTGGQPEQRRPEEPKLSECTALCFIVVAQHCSDDGESKHILSSAEHS